jgi:hypothetical protein
VEHLPREHHWKTTNGGRTDVDRNNDALAATLGIFNGTKHTEKIVVNISSAQQKKTRIAQ